VSREPLEAGAGRVGRRRARRARIAVAVAIGAVAIGVGALFLVPGATPGGEPAAADGPARPSRLVALSVTGAPHALLAVVGAGGDPGPAVLVLPPGATVVAPGQGETSLEGVAALPGESMRVAVSNAVGAWVRAFGVIDLDGLADVVDRHGGLAVDLPEAATIDGRTVGPGEARLDGPSVAEYLGVPADDAAERWALVLDALLADPPSLEEGDLAETDDAAAVAGTVRAAAGAPVEVAPTAPIAANALVLDQPAADELVRELFGTREPTRVLVQNGNGQPGIGEEVARLLLPHGFRVVLSQNADSFRHAATEIAATDDAFTRRASRVQELLGVGTVALSQVPSGLADITIVVGRDFTA
jgi:hypothetical protein